MKKVLLTSAVAIMAIGAAGVANAMPAFYASIKGSYVSEHQKHTLDKFGLQAITSPYAPGDKMGSINASTNFNDASLKLAVGVNAYSDDDLAIRAEVEKGFYGDNSTNSFDAFAEADQGNVQKSLTSTNDTWFANFYLDWKATSAITPYIGIGVGLNNKKVEFGRNSGKYSVGFAKDSDTGFAWNAQIGLAYNLTDSLALDLGYRYSDLGNFKMNYYQNKVYSDQGGAIDPESYMHHKVHTTMQEITLGVRYTF